MENPVPALPAADPENELPISTGNGIDRMNSDADSVDSVEIQDESEEGEKNKLTILDPNALEVDLNHHRLDKIENLEVLHQIETLSLRWNFIKKLENLSTLTTLREVEFYDNQITVIENLEGLVNLQ